MSETNKKLINYINIAHNDLRKSIIDAYKNFEVSQENNRFELRK